MKNITVALCAALFAVCAQAEPMMTEWGARGGRS